MRPINWLELSQSASAPFRAGTKVLPQHAPGNRCTVVQVVVAVAAAAAVVVVAAADTTVLVVVLIIIIVIAVI